MLIVASPIAEVWRRQGLQIEALSHARTGIEPVALAVRTQRALAAHRPYAAAVLRGHAGQEAERHRRQRTADSDIAALATALEARQLYRGLDEADLLRSDWSALLQGIGQRRLAATESDTAHDLLIEQTFVIADLVLASASTQEWHGARAGEPALEAELTLALRTALAQAHGQAATAEALIGRAEARLTSRIVALHPQRQALAAAWAALLLIGLIALWRGLRSPGPRRAEDARSQTSDDDAAAPPAPGAAAPPGAESERPTSALLHRLRHNAQSTDPPRTDVAREDPPEPR